MMTNAILTGWGLAEWASGSRIGNMVQIQPLLSWKIGGFGSYYRTESRVDC